MPYIEATDISATMTATRYSELTTVGEADNGAAEFALDQANNEAEAILIETYDDVENCPDTIKKQVALIGKYHLYTFNELVDKESSIYLDYLAALKHLKAIASGEESGLDDSTTEDDNPIPSRSRARLFDTYLEDWNDADETQHENDS